MNGVAPLKKHAIRHCGAPLTDFGFNSPFLSLLGFICIRISSLKKIQGEASKLTNEDDLHKLKKIVDELKLNDSILPELRKSTIQIAIRRLNHIKLTGMCTHEMIYLKKFASRFNIDKEETLITAIKDKISAQISNILDSFSKEQSRNHSLSLDDMNNLASKFNINDSILEIRKTTVEVAIKKLERLNTLDYGTSYDFTDFTDFIDFVKKFGIANEMTGYSVVIEEVINKFITSAEKNNSKDCYIKLINDSKLVDINKILQNPARTLSFQQVVTEDDSCLPRLIHSNKSHLFASTVSGFLTLEDVIDKFNVINIKGLEKIKNDPIDNILLIFNPHFFEKQCALLTKIEGIEKWFGGGCAIKISKRCSKLILDEIIQAQAVLEHEYIPNFVRQ